MIPAVLSLCLNLSLFGAWGQTALPVVADTASSARTLEELTVTADPFRNEVVKPQRLSGDDLSRLNAHSVADAVRYFSGVQLKDYGGVGGIKTLDIRSMGTNHMAVFYDGLPLGNAQNGQIDLGKFSLDNIEEIDLFNAQKSSVFQPARDFASSGSVYIRSRRPRFAEGRRFAGSVTFRAGSFGLVDPSARFDWKISEKTALTLNAEYTFATGRYKFRYRKRLPSGEMAWDTTAVRHNGDLHALRLEAGVFGDLPGGISGGSWMLKGYYYDSERGIPGAIVNNVWKNSQRQWDRNLFVQGNIRKALGKRFELMANAKYACDRMCYLNPDTTLMLIDNSFLQQESYLSVAGKYTPFRWWEITAAVDWQHNSLESDMRLFLHPRRHQLLSSLATALNLKNFHLRGSILLTEVYDRTHPENSPSQRKRFERLTPALFAAWIPSYHRLPEVRGFWKKAFRMPTFNDLYYTDIGNALLRPVGTEQYDLGATWRYTGAGIPEQFEISADIYHNRVSDKIIAVPKGTGQYRWMMMNIGKVRINGCDVSATSIFSLPLDITARLRLSYTFQSARDYSDPSDCLDEAGSYRGQIAYIPRHSGSVAASLQWHGAEINYSWIYVGERWDNSSNIPVNHVEPWYTSDLSLSYPVGIASSSLRITLEINNLANRQYEVIRNYPMPGRNFKLIASWNI